MKQFQKEISKIVQQYYDEQKEKENPKSFTYDDTEDNELGALFNDNQLVDLTRKNTAGQINKYDSRLGISVKSFSKKTDQKQKASTVVSKWSKEEHETLVNATASFGMNAQLIAQLLPHKTLYMVKQHLKYCEKFKMDEILSATQKKNLIDKVQQPNKQQSSSLQLDNYLKDEINLQQQQQATDAAIAKCIQDNFDV